MKAMMFSAALLSAAAIIPAAGLGSAAEAQSYRSNQPQTYEQCISQRGRQQATGAIIGGIAGAIIGAELHDESDDRRRAERYGHHGRGWDSGYRGRGWDRGYRGGYRGGYDRGRHDERGNDGAVIGGGALGALAGGVLGSAGPDCSRLPRQQGGGGYYNSGYAGGNGAYRAQSGGYDRSYDDYGYQDGRGYDGGLAGGPGYDDGYDDRYDDRYDDYRAAPSQGYSSTPSGRCRTVQSGGYASQVCQGADGIWRPAGR